jgi:hypothetical protein
MLGLSEDGSEDASALAVVQAGAAGKVMRSGAISPDKLIEMSEGFASYTAATAEVDRDGAGQTAAVTEFVKLLLDPEGSTLQDILVEETARLGDAATRSALKASLVDSPAAKAAAAAFRAPKDLLEQSPFGNLMPGPLKELLINRPAALPGLIEKLVATSEQDERILESATGLRDALSSRILPNNGGNVVRNAAAAQLNDGASMIPSAPSPPNFDAITSFLSDEESRKTVMETLPGVGALGRRVGAGLLRRAAYRTTQSSILPEGARKALVEANNALADAVDYDQNSGPEEEAS